MLFIAHVETVVLKMSGFACLGVAALLTVQGAGDRSQAEGSARSGPHREGAASALAAKAGVPRKPSKSGRRSAPRRLGVMVVGGQVKQPGEVVVMEGMTLRTAIIHAGDFTEFGALNRVILHRDGAEQIHDLKTPEGQAVEVLPGDTVEVSQKMWLGR